MTNEELQKIYVKADMEYDALKDNIHHLAEENKHLKDSLDFLWNKFKKVNTANRKAKEFIYRNCILSDEWKELDFCNFIPTGNITYRHLTPKKVKELLEILEGEIK